MKTNQLHSWSLTVEQAKSIQKNLSNWIVTDAPPISVDTFARVEVHPVGLHADQNKDQANSQTATVTLYSTTDLSILERKHAIKNCSFPATPGMMSFRKAPAVIAALEKLANIPDLIICDGRGRTGESTFGLASHVGLITNLPTIGIRAPLQRLQTSELGNDRGQWACIGENQCDKSVLVRVFHSLDPILVSPAHKISQKQSIEQVLAHFPESMPSRQYLESLYPSKQPKAHNIPILKSVAQSGT